MPVFHTKIIESILEPVAQQVSVLVYNTKIIYRLVVYVLVFLMGVESLIMFTACDNFDITGVLCHQTYQYGMKVV